MPTINARYELQQQLGAGGMGAVYLANDRLTGQTVALKQVRVPAQDLSFASRTPGTDSEDFRLALALEFRTLAGLRHPHIVSVLDYGFDAEGQPFFTMQLLSDAVPFIEYAQDRSAEEKVRLLTDLLRALIYLHRRGIIHRDLKPGNVMVTADGILKVLDFGLALHQQESVTNVHESGVGSIAYMAPELLLDEPASVQSDLYAVGVMLYELWLGKHPFNLKNMGVLVQSILNSEPDTSALDPALQDCLARLLAKQPGERFGSAAAVITALCTATGQPLPAEKTALRESYLQAARFVGRREEMSQLQAALRQSREGKGAAWLVGGESGVGKSRLLEELRVLALVRGVTVLRGQGVEGGGLPYQLWRDPVRRLALMSELSDMEAGVLKAIAPDMGTLLGRDVPDAPELDGAAGQQRLVTTIVNVARRQSQPVLLLLEDLQWAVESLEPLKRLQHFVAEMPLLIVASYRDDEVPDLPTDLPDMQSLTLKRLDDTSIARLSESMLGPAGAQPGVIALLKRETEGNAFFMVEVVRALAEDAGRLDAIGQMTLPAHILTGGVQQVVRRRLDRLPGPIRQWVTRLAVAGRTLDMPVVDFLTSDYISEEHNTADDDSPFGRVRKSIIVSLRDEMLRVCADASVMEVEGDTWRFAHDKIRETIIADLSDEARRALHRQVAEAIESAHPGDDARAVVLFEHWLAADVPEKVVELGIVAAKQAYDAGKLNDSLSIAENALSYAVEDDESRMHLLNQCGQIQLDFHDRPRTVENYEAALKIARSLQHLEGINTALYGLAFHYLERVKDVERGRPYVEETLQLSKGIPEAELHALNVAGILAIHSGDMPGARGFWEQRLTLARQLSNTKAIAGTLNNLGIIAGYEGDYDASRELYQAAINVFEELGARINMSTTLVNLASLAAGAGDFVLQRTYVDKYLDIWHEQDPAPIHAWSQLRLSNLKVAENDFAGARRDLMALYESRDEADRSMINSLAWMGKISRMAGDFTQAQIDLDKAEAITRLQDDPIYLAYLSLEQGLIAFDQREYEVAIEYLARGVSHAEQRNDIPLQLAAKAHLSRAYREAGATERAVTLLTDALAGNLHGQIEGVDTALIELAWAQSAGGDFAGARSSLLSAFDKTWGPGRLPFVLATLLSYAALLMYSGGHQRAAEIVEFAASHPAFGYAELENRANAALLRRQLATVLTFEEREQARVRAEDIVLDNLIPAILKDLSE